MTVFPECLLRRAAQPSPTLRSPRLSPTSAPTQRLAPTPIRSIRLTFSPIPPNSPSRSRPAREAQKGLLASPLLATLTHSTSCKSFACHSYANTRDMGATSSHFCCDSVANPCAKFFRIRSYEKCTSKSFRMRSYKKVQGVGGIANELRDTEGPRSKLRSFTSSISFMGGKSAALPPKRSTRRSGGIGWR
jgi:hypothetical protein